MEYDQRVLDITKQLCFQLKVADHSPTSISWETQDSRSRRKVEFRYDDCVIKKYSVALSAKMKDILEPDEFKPIIASSLIFSKKFRKRFVRTILAILGGFIVLSVALGFVLEVLFPQTIIIPGRATGYPYPYTLGLVIAFPIAMIMTALGTVTLSLLFAKRLRSRADRNAADAVSASVFLNTLNKICEFTRETGSRKRARVSDISLLPEIQVRIRRLQDYSQQFHQAKIV